MARPFGMCGWVAPASARGSKPTIGTPEFWAQYHAAIAGELAPAKPSVASNGSLAWLIERYRETDAWTDLVLATRRNRENHLQAGHQDGGAQPYRRSRKRSSSPGATAAPRRQRKRAIFSTPCAACSGGPKQAQHVATDPTDGVANPKRKKGPGFPVWTEDDVEAYEQRWPLGTQGARVARCVVLHRLAARRCRRARPPACPQRRRHAADRKEPARNHCHAADPACPAAYT